MFTLFKRKTKIKCFIRRIHIGKWNCICTTTKKICLCRIYFRVLKGFIEIIISLNIFYIPLFINNWYITFCFYLFVIGYICFVQWCRKHKDCERLDLMGLLVKPFQRLTKYSLLLKAILNKTDNETHKDCLNRMVNDWQKIKFKLKSGIWIECSRF